MTIQIDENIVSSPIFNEHTTFCLYIYLTTHAESNGLIYTSKNTLMKAMSMGFKKISHALDSLESKGYIVRLNKDAYKTTSIYQVFTSMRSAGMLPISDLKQASLNTELPSPNMRQGTLNMEQSSPNTTQGTLNMEQSSSNMRQGTLNTEQSSSNMRQGTLNMEQSSSTTRQGSLNTEQPSPTTTQDALENDPAVQSLALACARCLINNKYILFNQDIIQSNREGLSNREKDRVIEKGVIGEKEEETEREKKEREGKERDEPKPVKKPSRNKQTLSFDFVDPELSEAYMEFVKMRKTIGHPIKTQRCLEMNYNEALKLADNDLELAKKIIDQSTNNEWQGIFPLKEVEQPRKGLKWGSDTEQPRKGLKWGADPDRPYPRMFFNSDVEKYEDGVF